MQDEGREEINWLVEQLFKFKRPLAAVHAAAHVLHGSRRKVALDCRLLGDVLKRIATDPSDIDQRSIQGTRYDILQAIKHIQDQEELTKKVR